MSCESQQSIKQWQIIRGKENSAIMLIFMGLLMEQDDLNNNYFLQRFLLCETSTWFTTGVSVHTFILIVMNKPTVYSKLTSVSRR